MSCLGSINDNRIYRYLSYSSISLLLVDISLISRYLSYLSISLLFVDISLLCRYLSSLDISPPCRYLSYLSISLLYVDISLICLYFSCLSISLLSSMLHTQLNTLYVWHLDFNGTCSKRDIHGTGERFWVQTPTSTACRGPTAGPPLTPTCSVMTCLCTV